MLYEGTILLGIQYIITVLIFFSVNAIKYQTSKVRMIFLSKGLAFFPGQKQGSHVLTPVLLPPVHFLGMDIH